MVAKCAALSPSVFTCRSHNLQLTFRMVLKCLFRLRNGASDSKTIDGVEVQILHMSFDLIVVPWELKSVLFHIQARAQVQWVFFCFFVWMLYYERLLWEIQLADSHGFNSNGSQCCFWSRSQRVFVWDCSNQKQGRVGMYAYREVWMALMIAEQLTWSFSDKCSCSTCHCQ